jgi:hypothetical protein
MIEMKRDVLSTTDREIILTRVYAAPRERVFEVWTKPEHVSRWWGPHGFTTQKAHGRALNDRAPELPSEGELRGPVRLQPGGADYWTSMGHTLCTQHAQQASWLSPAA